MHTVMVDGGSGELRVQREQDALTEQGDHEHGRVPQHFPAYGARAKRPRDFALDVRVECRICN
jgi:hypothetical protein